MYEKFDDTKVKSGIGSALYVKNATGKYNILLALETIPSVSGSPESIEYDVTTSETKGKIAGKTTLEDKEVDFYWHRDNIRRLEAVKGKELSFLKVSSDYTAEKFTGSVSYYSQDFTSGDPEKGTMKITPRTYDGTIEDCTPLLQRTCHITSAIDGIVNLAVNATKEIMPELSNSAGTITATTSSESIATVAVASGKVTITAVASGSAVVTLKTSAENEASWETTVLVVVE